MTLRIREIPQADLFGPGNAGCRGCGAAIAGRQAMKALGSRTIMTIPASCMATLSGSNQRTAWSVPFYHTFAPFRTGGPMFAVVRTDSAPIRERSANNGKPDIVVVLDNSLFSVVDVTKGLRPGGTVMALGVSSDVLGKKADEYSFIPLDPFIRGSSMGEIEAGLLSSLEGQQVF